MPTLSGPILVRRTLAAMLLSCAPLAVPVRAESAAPTPAAESPAVTPAPAVAPAAPRHGDNRTYTFQVVLLVADNSTPAVVENVPAKAQKALKDLQDFLPYKSYHLVDMAWLRTSWQASSQITGPKGETYVIDLLVSSSPGEHLTMQQFRITQTAMLPPPGAAIGTSPAPRAVNQLLSSTFGMEVGETVVVGTAKLDTPGRALIVLLSALP
jgi:hypothetical protein